MKTVSNPDGTVGHESGEPGDADRCLGVRDCPKRDIHEYFDFDLVILKARDCAQRV